MKISELTIPEIENRLADLVNETIDIGVEWAVLKAECEDLEEKKRPMIASLASKFDGSESARERLALGSGDYKAFLDGLKLAREAYYRSQVAWDMNRTKVDVYRSILSTRREEMKNL